LLVQPARLDLAWLPLGWPRSPAPDLEPGLATMLNGVRAAGDVSYKRFRTPDELEDLLGADLALLLSERFLTEPSGPRPAEQAARLTLPMPVSDFVGRGAELDHLVQLFTQPEPRLVTLTGPGGVGKTRLALEAGRRVAPGFADGVGFVSLSPSATRLQAAIAAALRLPQISAEPSEASLAAYLLDKTALLILDNFESVIDQAAQVGELLAAAPRLRLLVTSRVALRLSGEQEVAVAPLTVPDAHADVPVVLGSEAGGSRFGGRSAFRPARRSGPVRLRRRRVQRQRGGADLPAPGRAAARHRAGRRSCRRHVPGGARGPARKRVGPAGPRP
jgi:hypothetical protein